MKLHSAVLETLEKIKLFDPKACIAGGYLRDMITGRQPKDIDIFVRAKEIEAVNANFVLAGATIDDSIATTLSYTEQPDVSCVYNFSTVNDKPVQIISLTTTEMTEKFVQHDFGICQVWHDGTDLHTTSEFDDDLSNNTFTLCFCENQYQFDRSMRRWERLKLKFPEFTLVIPEKYKMYEVTNDSN